MCKPASELVLGPSFPAIQVNMNIRQRSSPFSRVQGLLFVPWSGRENLPNNGKCGKAGSSDMGTMIGGIRLSIFKEPLGMLERALERAKYRSMKVTLTGTGCWTEPEIRDLEPEGKGSYLGSWAN